MYYSDMLYFRTNHKSCHLKWLLLKSPTKEANFDIFQKKRASLTLPPLSHITQHRLFHALMGKIRKYFTIFQGKKKRGKRESLF